MPDNGFIAVFLIGLMGGVHCIAMCGGIVGALSAPVPGAAPTGPRSQARSNSWSLHLGYNVGRITSYSLAGAAAGALGSVGLIFEGLLPVQLTLYVLANVMLIALGLYLTGFTRALALPERAGRRLWAWLAPRARRFLPARSVAQSLPLGFIWGFLPCGMVYSVLTAALLAGSAARGAGLMLAFGLGTLPNLLCAGLLLQRLQAAVRARWLRFASGLLVLAFGVFGLANVLTLGGRLWAGICHA